MPATTPHNPRYPHNRTRPAVERQSADNADSAVRIAASKSRPRNGFGRAGAAITPGERRSWLYVAYSGPPVRLLSAATANPLRNPEMPR